MVTKNIRETTRILGSEFDDSLRERLMEVLRELGATPLGQAERLVVGSQDLELLDLTVDGRTLRVESETYIGLSISCPSDLVETVAQQIAAGE